MNSLPVHLVRPFAWLFPAIFLCAVTSVVAQPAKQSFNLPADVAERSLKSLSSQSGLEVVFSTEVAGGVRTNQVKGEFSALEAAHRMLADTPLAASQNAADSAIVVSRKPTTPPEKNAPRAAPAVASGDRPNRNAASDGKGDEAPVKLSPFEVVADTKGYQATNTMSGTRLNTKLEDLASAITVITKEQMADFAMLDINDVFLYAVSTEGTGTYTSLAEDTTGGQVSDNTAGDPANANRVRGIGNANVSNGNFETSNRVPIDPIDADGVEISRGPNASIFGLGNPSGTVNILNATANLQRNRSQVGFRADSFDGHRTTLDLNRVLVPGKLGLRASVVRQHDGFDLKPSGVDTVRYNGIVQFRPFKRTTINASYQYYHADGNRPNSVPPQDGITDWREMGSPTWDTVTNSVKVNGVVVRSGVVTRNDVTPYFQIPASNYGLLFVEPGGIKYWGLTYGVTGNTPFTALLGSRMMVASQYTFEDAQPLIARRVAVVTDKSIYDWSRININAPNYFADKTETSRVTVDQILVDSRRQSLAVQFGWFREDSERFNRYIMAGGPTQGTTGQLVIDVNERLLDGIPNPYFLRPAMLQVEPRPKRSPLRNDTYRAQFAYKLDFASDQGFRRWLGTHNLVGYGEYKDQVQRTFTTRDEISSVEPWTFPDATGNRRSNQPVRTSYRFYVGDNQGQNVDYAPGSYAYGGPYTFNWGNGVTGAFNRDPVELGELPLNSSGSHVIQKTQGVLLQSQFLSGRIVATVGLRNDRHYTQFQNDNRLTNRGFDFDYDFINQWQSDDWQFREGRTEQRGVVVKPFRGLAFIERPATQGTGLTRFLADTLRGATVHYNRSDSFKPAAPAQDVFGVWLPDPSGRGKDYGFSLNLFDGKLGLRVNKYETRQLNSRNGPSAGTASILGLDYTANAGGVFFDLQDQATGWLTAAAAAKGQTLTPEQLNGQLATLMGVTPRDANTGTSISRSETDDILARGHEIELHFNPTPNWTVQASVTEQQTINTHMAPNVTRYAAQRLPYWTTIKDPRIDPAVEPGQLWWDHYYGGGTSETPHVFYNRSVGAPLKVAQVSEGIARPQIRRYGGRLSTNFRLVGLTEQPLLKRFNVGGALRYESRGAIGFYGVQQLPAIITDYDINRPIWDKAHVYVDALVGYRTKLFADKIGATFQLNIRNLTEGGRLQPFGAFPDGTPYVYRIVSPRQFILSATFDL